MRTIPLTQGQVAFVDDEDYPELVKYKWRAAYSPRSRTYYATRGICINHLPTTVMMHRSIMTPPSGFLVDHINFDGLDNQRSNLRLCSRNQNNQHIRPQARGTSSRFKGVYWSKKASKWRALIKANSQKYHLGYFILEEDAACAYNQAALRYHGEFACLNQISGQCTAYSKSEE